MGGSRAKYFLIFLLGIFFISCQNSSPNKAANAKIEDDFEEALILKVDKETFINGKKFCELYVNTSAEASKEYGVRIDVPKDYNNPKEKISLYAYTRKPFDPKLPTFIFVDGGPGQNTHQDEDVLEQKEKTQFNQINFDQRGVGCSTPDTWELYSDSKLYSSQNTIKDMEEIRKYFGVDQWSIYGVSYGTVPATMYAATYSRTTRSLVLEGVVGAVENLGRFKYASEKWNAILKTFNEKQRKAFNEIFYEQDYKKLIFIIKFLSKAGYADAGFRRINDRILFKLFPEDGGFNQEEYIKLRRIDAKKMNQFSTPQQPRAVDNNILGTFYCKELKAFEKDKYTLGYDETSGFYEKTTTDSNYWHDECRRLGISENDTTDYEESKYPVYKHVYYLQGSHDVATVPLGAINHWKNVPKSSAYFLFSLYGGHNPGLSKLSSKNEDIKRSHQELYSKAFLDLPIEPGFINTINQLLLEKEDDSHLKNVLWQLYLNFPSDLSRITEDMKGIKKIVY